MRGKSAVVTFDHDPSAGTERLRPPGEDAPAWLAALLAIAGVLASIWVAGEVLEPRILPADLPVPVARPEPNAPNEQPGGMPPAAALEPLAKSATPAPPVTLVAPNRETKLADEVARGASPSAAPTPEVLPPPLAPTAPGSETRAAGAPSIARPDEPTPPPAAATPVIAPEPAAATRAPTTPSQNPGAPTPSLASTPADTPPTAAPVTAPPASSSAAPPSPQAPSPPAPATPAAATTPLRATAPCLPMVTIPFGHDSTKPLVEGREAAVRPLVDWLAAHPEATVSVEGHADTVGTEDYNIVLSFGRARAVADWLVRLGVAPGRITPRAAGTTPAKGSSADLSTNRLVVLQIEGVDVCRTPGDAAKRP